jgi:FAD/FMN-containing dehydrogenase
VFKVEPLPASGSYFSVSWPWAAADQVIAAWLGWAPRADHRITSVLHLAAGGGSPSVGVAGQFIGLSSQLPGGLLSPLELVSGAQVSTSDHPYLELQERWAGCLGLSPAECHTAGTAPGGTLPRASFYAKSDYVDRALPVAARANLITAIEARLKLAGSGAILFDAYGGAINRVAPDATAFVHRQTLCSMQYLSYDGGAAWLDQTWKRMRPYVSGMAYQNYIDPSLPGWREAFYGENLSRLEAIRRRVDPDHFFQFPQAI